MSLISIILKFYIFFLCNYIQSPVSSKTCPFFSIVAFPLKKAEKQKETGKKNQFN